MKLMPLNQETLNLLSDRLDPFILYNFGNRYTNWSKTTDPQIHSIYCNKFAVIVVIVQTDSLPMFIKIGDDYHLEYDNLLKMEVYFALNEKNDHSLSDSLIKNLLLKIKYKEVKPVFTDIQQPATWSIHIILHNSNLLLIYKHKVIRISLDTMRITKFTIKDEIITLAFSKESEKYWVCSYSETFFDTMELTFYQWNSALGSKNPKLDISISVTKTQFELIREMSQDLECILFLIEREKGKFMIVSSDLILLFDRQRKILMEVVDMVGKKTEDSAIITLELLTLKNNLLFFRNGSKYWIFEDEIDVSKLSTVFRSIPCDETRKAEDLQSILDIFRGREWYETKKAEITQVWSFDLYEHIFQKFDKFSRPTKNVLFYIIAKRLTDAARPGLFNFVYNLILRYEKELLPVLQQIKLWVYEQYSISE